jgi:hypothetical protein
MASRNYVERLIGDRDSADPGLWFVSERATSGSRSVRSATA